MRPPNGDDISNGSGIAVSAGAPRAPNLVFPAEPRAPSPSLHARSFRRRRSTTGSCPRSLRCEPAVPHKRRTLTSWQSRSRSTQAARGAALQEVHRTRGLQDFNLCRGCDTTFAILRLDANSLLYTWPVPFPDQCQLQMRALATLASRCSSQYPRCLWRASCHGPNRGGGPFRFE